MTLTLIYDICSQDHDPKSLQQVLAIVIRYSLKSF